MMNGRNIRWRTALSPVLWMITATAVSLATSPVMAREGKHKRHPGYVDGSAFAKLAGKDGSLIEISINGALLKTVASALAEENEDIGGFLDGIVGISAVVIEHVEDDDGSAVAMAADIADNLKEDGWEKVAHVREHGGSVTVMVLLDDKQEGSLAGITVMVNEIGGNVVFANIAGRIDLAVVAKLGLGLGIPGLDELTGLDLGDTVKRSKGKSKKRGRE